MQHNSIPAPGFPEPGADFLELYWSTLLQAIQGGGRLTQAQAEQCLRRLRRRGR